MERESEKLIGYLSGLSQTVFTGKDLNTTGNFFNDCNAENSFPSRGLPLQVLDISAGSCRAHPLQTTDLAETHRSDLDHGTNNRCCFSENNQSRNLRDITIDWTVQSLEMGIYPTCLSVKW
jgi:hypothetical protein